MNITALAAHRLAPNIALWVAMILWGLSFIAMKLALDGFPPTLVIFGRMFIASLCFICMPKFWKRGFVYRKGDWKFLLFLVLCEPFLYFLFEAYALTLTSVAEAGMITAALPLLVAVAAGLVLKEKLGPRTWVGFFMAVAGVIWLSASALSEGAEGRNHFIGNFLEFLAMCSATGYAISVRYLSANYSSNFITAMQAFAGCLLFSPSLLVYGAELSCPLPFEASMAVLFLGVCVTIGAYGLYNFGLCSISAGMATAYINLIPVFTLLFSYLLLGETLNGQQVYASALVLFGVLLSQSYRKKTSEQAAAELKTELS